MPYPALPGHRFAYDVDGTIVQLASGGASWTVVSQASLALANDEDDDAWVISVPAFSNRTVSFLFPEPRNLAGIFARWTTTNVQAAMGTPTYSTDTTDGINGTWTNTTLTNKTAASPLWRSSIDALNLNSIRGYRLYMTNTDNNGQNLSLYQFNLYGVQVTPPGLVFWHPTLDQALTAPELDLGDVVQGATATRTFRLKNAHATQTAFGVTATTNVLSNTMTLDYSVSGGAYGPTAVLGDLAPGIISTVVTVRRIVPTNELALPQAARIAATATSWA